MENAKVYLHLYDSGDSSVGLSSCSWSVECPFIREDVDEETLKWFKDNQVMLYKDFTEGRLTAFYSFETL